jgi:hypothetical protein
MSSTCWRTRNGGRKAEERKLMPEERRLAREEERLVKEKKSKESVIMFLNPNTMDATAIFLQRS